VVLAPPAPDRRYRVDSIRRESGSAVSDFAVGAVPCRPRTLSRYTRAPGEEEKRGRAATGRQHAVTALFDPQSRGILGGVILSGFTH